MINMKRMLFILGVFAVMDSAVSQDAYPVQVADGVYSYGDPAGYFSMFVVTGDGVIAIDPINTPQARGLVAAIKSVTDQPIRYLLHTHNHWDHSGGGQVFRDEGATIIAHVDAYEWMRANPHPDMALPDESWGGHRKQLVLGDKTVEFHHFGPSHGHGMTVFLVQGSQVAYIADLVAPNRLPFLFLPDFNVSGLERTLEQILTLDIDKVVYTHNPSADARQGGSKQAVADTLQYFRDLRAAMDAEIKAGTPARMVPAAVRLPKYENWAMYNEWLALNAWKIWLEGHLGPF